MSFVECCHPIEGIYVNQNEKQKEIRRASGNSNQASTCSGTRRAIEEKTFKTDTYNMGS